LSAIFLVIFNDRALKVHHPGVVSGKLSDFAGLVYFPLFVVSCVEGVRWLARRDSWQLTNRAASLAVLVIGFAFVLTKTSDVAGETYRTLIGGAMWPISVAGSLIRGEQLPALERGFLAKDPTDLIAVPMLLLPIWISRRIMIHGQSETPPCQLGDSRGADAISHQS
jgi:hypothetical protein